MKQGYIQIYTGNGKGKTTAALGISLRAVCAGKRVFFGQFIKGMKYSELRAPEYLPNFVIKQFGRGCFIENKPEEGDIIAARKGLEVFDEVLKSGEYDLVVLDEVNVAIHFGLIETEQVLKVLKNRTPWWRSLISLLRCVKLSIITKMVLKPGRELRNNTSQVFLWI